MAARAAAATKNHLFLDLMTVVLSSHSDRRASPRWSGGRAARGTLPTTRRGRTIHMRDTRLPANPADRGAGSVGLDQRLQCGQVLHHGVGVTLELLIRDLRALPKSEDHFAPIAVADHP